jgi:hypothetical protein
MRTVLAAALVIVVSGSSTWLGAGTASAQSHARSRSNAQEPTSSIGLPLSSIGLPLPTIGLPLPPMGLAPPTRPPSILNSFRGDRVPPRDGARGNRRAPRSALVFVPAFGYGWPYVPDSLLPGTPVPSPPSLPQVEYHATGRLHITLQSGGDPQIYVDGYYVGLMSDLGGDLTLDAGGHTLELRDEGYETLHVDVQIAAGALITYRGAMKRLAAASAPAASALVAQLPSSPDVPPPVPTTIYMIPGCYVGNVPPRDASLPAGCDEDRAIAFPSRP